MSEAAKAKLDSTGGRIYEFLGGQLVVSEQEIFERACALPGDMVVLSGTLVEGIGNKHSDIDLYVIGDELPDAQRVGPRSYIAHDGGRVRAYYDYLSAGGFGFDVEYLTRAEVEGWKDEVLSLYERARASTKILRQHLSDGVGDGLHKLRVGRCVQNADEYAAFFDEDFWNKLAFIFYSNRKGGYPEFKDIMGAWGSGDYDTSLHIMRETMRFELAALCHLHGMTNGRTKWLFQNYKRLPERFQGLVKEVMTWLNSERLTDEAKRDSILAGCDIIDRIYRADAIMLRERAPLSYTPEEALRMIEEEYAREVVHDRQTIAEYEHRRRVFTTAVPDIRSLFLASA